MATTDPSHDCRTERTKAKFMKKGALEVSLSSFSLLLTSSHSPTQENKKQTEKTAAATFSYNQ
jgi:hypothetical protein